MPQLNFLRGGLTIVAAIFMQAPISAAQKPNVLLVCVDDLKPNLGCYGDTLAKTPNIDRLAQNGVLFERAYCNQAVCSPSRNALLTSLRPQTLGIYDLATNFRQSRPGAVTLPEYFKKNGYRTEGLGKVFHVGHGNHEDAQSWSVPHFQVKSIGYALKENKGPTREGALFENQNPANLPRGAAYEMADVPDNAYGDGQIADEAIRRLEQAKADGQIRAFTGNDYQDDLLAGNMSACVAWSGDVAQLALEQPTLRFVVPRSGGLLWADLMVMPRGARHRREAAAWMNFVYDPPQAARIAAAVHYISPVQGVQAILAADPATARLAASPLMFPDAGLRARLQVFGPLSAAEEARFDERFASIVGA